MLRDAEVEELQRRERSEQIQGYRLLRDTVLEHRRREAQSRTALIQGQLEMYDGMQVSGPAHRRPGGNALQCTKESERLVVRIIWESWLSWFHMFMCKTDINVL